MLIMLSRLNNMLLHERTILDDYATILNATCIPLRGKVLSMLNNKYSYIP